jgi:tetratricopeptide (TPR) repeat protein
LVKGGAPVEENRAISSHVACLCNLGTSMARSKNYRGAHICFDKLIKDLPQYHFGYRGKAWTYFLEDNLADAASFMRKAFEKNSDHKILQQEYEFIHSMSVNVIETKKMASILEGFFTPSVPQEKPSEEFEKEIDILNLSQTSGGDGNVWDNLLVDDNRLLVMEKRVNKILEEKLKEFEMVSSWRDKIASQESEEGEGD